MTARRALTAATPFGVAAAALLDALTAAFGHAVKTVDLLPSVLTKAELQRIATSAPGVYVAFGAAQRTELPELVLTGGWTVSLVATHAGAAVGRLTGDALGIGLFEMAAVAAATLDGMVIDGCGTVEITGIENVHDAEALAALGIAVYAITLRIPMPINGVIPTALLPKLPGGGAGPGGTAGTGAFTTLHTDFDLPPVPSTRQVLDDAEADAVGNLKLEGS